nr:hypothetical protein ACMD2_04623 [Ipomoea batatas]
MKHSSDRPGTLNATSSMVHASSILVFVWLVAVSPKRKRVTTDRPDVASVCLDSGELGVFQVHEKSRFLAEIAKDNVPYYLGRSLAPGLQCVWISSEFEDETILTIDLLFARAFCIGKHVDSSSRVHVCAKPRRMPPNEATVRASVNFIATKRKLNVPHVGIHLPEHKTTRIRRFRRVPVLYNLGGCLEIRGQHLQLAHRICIGDTLKLLAPRSGHILLQDVLS